MVFGDVIPAFAAEPPETEGEERVVSDENSEAGGVVSDLEEEEEQKQSGTEQQPDTPDAAPPADTNTENPGQPEGSGKEDAEPSEDLEVQEEIDAAFAESAGADAQLQEIEMDSSEYILQAGGSGILPEAEDGGIVLFSADAAERTILNGLQNRQERIDISSFGLTKETLKPVYVKVLNNNPKLFYVASQWSMWVDNAGNVTAVAPKYLEQYDASSSAKYEAAVNEALKSINNQMDDVEKALALHDYLVLSCAYENDGQGNYQNYNAYNALVDEEAVCQGYTLAYTDLLQRVGIPVSYVTSDGLNHIWNLVEIDNKWYHVDNTWDDPVKDRVGRVNHNNFLQSDDGIAGTGHVLDDGAETRDWVTGIEGITCTDDGYASGQFWNGLSTAVFFEGNACYYMSQTGKLIERSGMDSERIIYDLGGKWPAWGNSGAYYSKVFTSLSRSGACLYFNGPSSVFRVSLASLEATAVYTYEDGYLYGSCARGNELRLIVGTDPNTASGFTTIDLPEIPLGPENLTFTWNTIDGGSADSSAPEKGRMKLLVFAPQWAFGYLSNFYVNSLFRDNKYMDVVVLDTQGQDPEEIRKNLPDYYMSEHPDAPITYCYYKETEINEEDYRENGSINYDVYYKALEEKNPILQAYKKYRTLTGMEEYTEDIGREYMACFLINSRNEVVYSDSQSCGNTGSDLLVNNVVNAINEKKYLRPEVSLSVTFRKDEERNARFEWEKGAGAAGYIMYYDPDEEKVRSKDCQSYTVSYADSPEYGMTDEGFATWGITGDGEELCYFHLILKDKYGLIVGDSGIVKPQGNTADNLNIFWNTVDGGTISSQNTNKDKLKILVFVPMNTSYQEAFYQQRLFRGKKYVETVILDTSKQSRATVKSKRDAVEKANAVSTGTSALTYCYDASGENVKNAFLDYCAQVGADIEYNPKNVAYFVIDQNNQIVDYFVITPQMVPQYATNSLVLYLVGQIREHKYLSSDIAAPNVRITEHKTGKVVLEWDKVSGAGGYTVYRADSPDGPFRELGECTVDSSRHETKYTDTELWGVGEKNPDLYYRVATKDSYWVLGPWSEVVTNKGMPQDVDPMRFKELHLVDEAGQPVTSIDIHEGELKKLYPELERYNGQKVRLDTVSQTQYISWELVKNYSVEEDGDIRFDPDMEEAYATIWYEDLANPLRGGVVGRKSTNTDGTEAIRYVSCHVSGSIGNDPYDKRVFIPVHVQEAEAGVSYPPIESPVKNLFTNREELNQFVRDAMVDRTERITFCVPMETWNAWNEDKTWDMDGDVLDFYQDREGMKSWEGDYLFHSMANLLYGPLNSMRYQGTEYRIYAIDLTYWDSDNQDQKVGGKLEELIWKPTGALYPYHDATEYEIVKACMDWIRKNVSYIGTPDPRYHSAYSALFNKKATCEGYSLLLYRMLREFGISNRILMGIDTNAHTYNIVEIDGMYYYTDPTSGAMLKGEQNFKHTTWQEMYLRDEYTKNVASRISKTDFNPADSKIVRLYRITDQENQEERIGSYKTLAEAKEAMEAGGTYRIDLLGGLTLKMADELDFPAGTSCTLNLNSRTLTVPAFAGNAEVRVRADLLDGGSNGKGSIKAATGQKLYLGDDSQERPVMLSGVAITGTPDITIGSNVTVDAASNLAAGALTVPETSTDVVLNGTITAKTLKYSAADMEVGNLTVSEQTTVEVGSTLNVNGNAAFGNVKVKSGIFHLNLVRTLDADGETLHTGTAVFKGSLEKAAEEAYAVEITRTKITSGPPEPAESDPFMPEDALITITGKESAIPARYFQIPDDPYGRELSVVREGNVLKVKGVVVEVSLGGQTQKYISVDAAVAGIKTDFGNQKGAYRFTFLGDAVLTKNLTLPTCVEELELKAAQKEQGQLFATLNLQGFTLSTSASVTLYEGLQLLSGRQAKLSLTGNYGEKVAFQVAPLSGAVTWIDALGQSVEGPGRRDLARFVEIAAPKGIVVLCSGEKASDVPEGACRLSLQNISARGLFIEDGAWSLQNVVLSEKYQVDKDAEVMQIDVTLSNMSAKIEGISEVDGSFTMSNTQLLIGETGALGGMLVVKSAYKNESAVNGYTVENRGRLSLASLEMADGTLFNRKTAFIATIKNCKNLINEGEKSLLISKSIVQNSKGKSILGSGSVIVVQDRAVLYNAELGGAYFYQNKGCSTALEGKTILGAGLPEEGTGLEFAQISISEEEFYSLAEELEAAGTTVEDLAKEKLSIQKIAPQTCLFTTKDTTFPTQYVSVRQADSGSPYTKVYRMGVNVRVGKEWIGISAKKLNGEEERLEGFILWSDAMSYLSNLSNPNMTYIVDILEDVDIEQGLTMPGKAAGLVIRGTDMPVGGDETRKNVLTYTGDLNLTMPLEFSGIELRAKKNGADYESAVKVNGMRLTFSDGASAVFSSVKGNTSSILALNDNSQVEVHGEINVGQLWSEGGGCLTGLAAVKRDSKTGNITAVTPQITVSGQIDIQNGQIQILLKEKITANKVTSYSALDFMADEAAQIWAAGIRLAKMSYANPKDFTTPYESAPMSKKDGYLVCFRELDPGVKLIYGANGSQAEIPFRTFAEAVAEINSLKTKQDYTIQIQEKAAEFSKESPAALAMPNKNYISGLCIEAAGIGGEKAEIYYLGGMTLTSHTVLKNVAFKKMVKSGKTYVSADKQSAGYPSPVSLKTGGFDLTISGDVTFDTPLNLDGGKTGTFFIKSNVSLVTVTNGITTDSDSDEVSASVIAGSIKQFKTFDVSEGQEICLVPYGTATKKGTSYSTAELNVAGMTIERGGNVSVEGGNAVVKDLVLNGGTLTAAGEKAGKVLLTNVTLKGEVRSEIYADRDFTISGTLDNQTENVEFYTRQKPAGKGAVQMPYLNIAGKATSAKGRIMICVLPNDCSDDSPVLLSDAPKASGQLLTAKTAGVEHFAADPDNLISYDSENVAEGKGELYSLENPGGYMLAKSGSNIYVYGSEQVAVALCKGDVSVGSWRAKQVVNYYPSWAEAVAALNGLNQTKETYTLLLLKDVGAENVPLKLTLPSKAAKVYVASVASMQNDADDGKKIIHYQNALSLGTHTEFVNVTLHPVTAKGADTALGISAENFDLTLKNVDVQSSKNDGSQGIKDISGKGKGNVVLESKDLVLTGGISGVKRLTVRENARVLGAVKADDLVLEGTTNLRFTTGAAVTVTNIISRGNYQNTLTYTRTKKDLSNLTVNGEIQNEGGKKVWLDMQAPYLPPLIRDTEDYVLTREPLKNDAWKVDLKDTKKLAVMPKASTSDFVFTMGLTPVSESELEFYYGEIVKANKGIYLLDKEIVGNEQQNPIVELEVSGREERIRCLDYTQAVNEINSLSDGRAEYILHFPVTCADTNIADNNAYGTLPMPANGKAAAVTLSGDGERTYLTFGENISTSGNLTLERLQLNPVTGKGAGEPADFNISVTGSAKNGGGSLTLDQVCTREDRSDWENRGLLEMAPETPSRSGHINQISGTKNVTHVTIKNSQLSLKTGVTNTDILALENSRLLTCKTSVVNKLSIDGSTWDSLGATTITDITGFWGEGSYLAGKQDAKSCKSQLTVNGKAEVRENSPVVVKVIASSDTAGEVGYVDSYKDVELLKAPREAAGRFKAAWEEAKENPQTGWVEPGNRIYYKDTANYVLCGDRQEMAVRLTGTGSDEGILAETYAKSWQDAVTIINSRNDPGASYTMNLLKQEILTGKNGVFGGITFPSNNKAASLEVRGMSESAKTTLVFSGNLATYGNVTLENVIFRAIKNLDKKAATPFTITADGAKNASSLTLRDVEVSPEGGALKDIGGKNKAEIVLDSEGLTLSGGVSGTPGLVVRKNVVVKGVVKTDVLTLSGYITFTVEGAVTVTDIKNMGIKNTLAYGRTAKNVSNLTVNGRIINEGGILYLDMKLPEGKLQKDYELILENPKAGVLKATLNDAKKLAVMPKASTSDFVFCVNGEEGVIVVKANKGIYLAGDALAERSVELETGNGTVTQCLDYTQAINEINTLSDGTQSYILYLPGDLTDTNLTDMNPYGAAAMPGSGKAKELTLDGKKDAEDGASSGRANATLTFSGEISANGKLALEHLVLEPVKSTSNRASADFNLSVAGNAKTGGATLILNDVRTVSDARWDWNEQKLTTENQVEIAGFINQISGTKNVTNVIIQNSKLRLKTGITNVDTLALENSRVITCNKSAINKLSVDGSSWDALGATTIADITGFSKGSSYSYLAGKQDAKKQPQLTLNGRAAESVTVKVIVASKLATEIQYVDAYQDAALLKAPKEAAGKFMAVGYTNLVPYKNTANYVLLGDEGEMEVKIAGAGSEGEDLGETYAKCWQDAVTIINNTNELKATYVLELLRTGEENAVKTGKGGDSYAGLTLPSKTAGVIVQGIRDDSGDTVLAYTGTLKPGCKVQFTDIVLTEGTVKKNVFTPTYQITLALGNADISFRNTSTLKNPNAGSEEAKADLVVASATASKGVLTLDREKVYVKGSFTVPNLCVKGDVVLAADKAVTLTDIYQGENDQGEDANHASLVLDTKVTAITRAGQQSVTQLSIKGKIGDVEVGIAPQMYDLSQKTYHRLTAYEARAMLAGEAKPDAGKKLANVSKAFAYAGDLKWLYSYEPSWSMVETEGTDQQKIQFYVYNNGLYVRAIPES